MKTIATLSLLLGSLLLSACSGTVQPHGNLNAGVTGSATDPKDVQYHIGGQIDFAKKPRR